MTAYPGQGPPAVRQSSVSPGLTLGGPRRRRRVVETDEYVGFLERVLAAAGRRVAAGDVEALADLLALSGHLERAIQGGVSGLRGHGYSWSEIGRVAKITKQSAHQRWSGEPEQAAGGDR